MSGKDIILDPISILQMSTYFEKKLIDGRSPTATFGLLYAQQVELKYRICWSVPISNNAESVEDLMARATEYEGLRLKRSKTTVNFYQEYNLVGCYIMRKEANKQEDEKVRNLGIELSKKGAPFYIVANPDEPNPKIYQNSQENKPILLRYASEMEAAEKLCIDSMYQQNSKESSIIKKCVDKQKNMMEVYISKIRELLKKLEDKDTPEKKKRQILEVLEDYDRLVAWNNGRKRQTVDAMNYSVMVGIGLNQYLKK